MVINCIFENVKFNSGEEFYGCVIKDVRINENKDIEIAGKHLYGMTNNDVLHIQIENCTVTKVPQGLTTTFPNLKNLVIRASKLRKISKNDLIEYKNFEKILCDGNELEFLPGNLFEGFEKLEFINFSDNKLEIIEPNILDGMEHLKHVNFAKNSNYTKFFSIYRAYCPNATLDETKNQLFDKFFSRFKFLQDLKQENLELQHFKDAFRDENNILLIQRDAIKRSLDNTEKRIQKLKKSEEKLKFENEILKAGQPRLIADLSNFIQDETTKDFRIQIDDREFPVHKFLLAARSPTLAEILRNNPEVENLNLVDISVEIFEVILKFLYTDELPQEDGTNFLHLFAAAGKLKIVELKNFAALKLVDEIDEENALEILSLSIKYEQNELKNKAFEEIKKKYREIEFKDEWISNSDILAKVVKMLTKKEKAKREFDEELEEITSLR